jgi:hypothetical protein
MHTGIITFPFVRTSEYFKSGNDVEILTNWYIRIMKIEANVKSYYYLLAHLIPTKKKADFGICHAVYMNALENFIFCV